MVINDDVLTEDDTLSDDVYFFVNLSKNLINLSINKLKNLIVNNCCRITIVVIIDDALICSGRLPQQEPPRNWENLSFFSKYRVKPLTYDSYVNGF